MSLRKSFALKFLKLRAIFTLSRDFGSVNFLTAYIRLWSDIPVKATRDCIMFSGLSVKKKINQGG